MGGVGSGVGRGCGSTSSWKPLSKCSHSQLGRDYLQRLFTYLIFKNYFKLEPV